MFRKLVNRRTIAAVSGSTVVAAAGGYYYLNSGPTYQPSTKETRRPPPPWTPPSREQMLDALRSSAKDPNQEFDLLVVGGGATGAGVALDPASRGLKVALVERDDFSAGEFHGLGFCERALPIRHACGNLGEGECVGQRTERVRVCDKVRAMSLQTAGGRDSRRSCAMQTHETD